MSKSTKEEAKKGEGREETWTALHGVCNAVARFPFGAAAMLTGVFVRSQQDDLHKETTGSPLGSDCSGFQACCHS